MGKGNIIHKQSLIADKYQVGSKMVVNDLQLLRVVAGACAIDLSEPFASTQLSLAHKHEVQNMGELIG